jgi:transglutaminase-like putative cysteine protease
MVNRIFLQSVFLFCIASTALAGSHSGRVVMEIDLTAQENGKWVRLWVPYPISDADQKIENISYSGDYSSCAVYTDQVNGNPILFALWDESARSRKLTLSFSAQRREVIRRDFPSKEAPWDAADYSQYLAPTSLGPVDGAVKELSLQITKGQETVLGKAQAIYEWTCKNMYRDPNTRGCGKGDVCSLLDNPGGKCTDISSVFVALARASGVPAREIFGIRLGKRPEEDITGYQHCWAEFYLPGYGWVPVDPADVRKAMLVEKLELENPRTSEYKAYFWGGIDPYRIKLSVGRDVILNPPQAGEPLNAFGYPFAQVGGRTVDWLDAAGFKYKITFNAG